VLVDTAGRPLRSAAARHYDAAAGGRRWVGLAQTRSVAGAAHAARGTVMARARTLVANNPLAHSGVEAWVSGLVGTGIKPQSNHFDPEVRSDLNLRFEAWTDEADHQGRTDLYGLQSFIAKQVVRDGEAFVRFVSTEGGSFRLQVIDPEMVDPSLTRRLGSGGYILHGIEFDADNQRRAYHVRREAPDMPTVLSSETVRVLAEDMVHIYRQDAAGQVRGVSWLAPVLAALHDMSGAQDAQLMRQKVAAMLAGFVTTADGGGAGFSDDYSQAEGGVVEPVLEPGTMQVLRPGEDIRFSEPARVGSEVIDFLRVTRLEIAAGLGIPVHLLDGDLTRANYSSLRAGAVEFRRKVEALQWSMFVHQLLRPIWRRWTAAEAIAGRIPPAYFSDPLPYEAAKWVTPRVDWVDPEKDMLAEVGAISAGLMSRRQAVASRGLDIEALDAEIAADRDRERKLGLKFTTTVGGSNE